MYKRYKPGELYGDNLCYHKAIARIRESAQMIIDATLDEALFASKEACQKKFTSKNASVLRRMVLHASEQSIVAIIISEIAYKFGLLPHDLIGYDKTLNVVEARSSAIAEVYARVPSLSLTAIGYEFGGRDRSTIAKAVRARNTPKRKGRFSRYRQDVLRLHRKGWSVNEIVLVLGCSRATVKSILNRAQSS